MESLTVRLAALADPARRRIVDVLAERPRSVGVVARLAGLRQPQTSKHLRRLEEAGLLSSSRSGQRRIYALEAGPLRDLARWLDAVADRTEEHRGDREAFDAYAVSRAAEVLAADRERWADGRTFTFHRSLPAPRDRAWRHLTDPDLLRRWWAPHDLTVSEVVMEAYPGGRVVLEYRDVDDESGHADGVVGRAEGTVDEVVAGERLAYRLSPILPDGTVAFTGHYELTLRADGVGQTDLDVRLRITDTTVPSADFIAGIELGWSQCLDRLSDLVSTPANTQTEEKK